MSFKPFRPFRPYRLWPSKPSKPFRLFRLFRHSAKAGFARFPTPENRRTFARGRTGQVGGSRLAFAFFSRGISHHTSHFKRDIIFSGASGTAYLYTVCRAQNQNLYNLENNRTNSNRTFIINSFSLSIYYMLFLLFNLFKGVAV